MGIQKEKEELRNTKFFPITNDYVFTKVLTKNPDLLEELIFRITSKRVKAMTINQQEVKNPKMDSIGSRYDVFIVSNRKEMYDLEMQNKDEKNLAKRSRYYLSVNDVDVLTKRNRKGQKNSYNDLPYSNIIFICTFDPFHQKAERYEAQERLFVKNNGGRMDVTNQGQYYPGYKKIFLNVSGNAEIHNVNGKLRNTIRYMTNQEITDDFTQKLHKEVKEVNRKDREALMTEEMRMIELEQETEEKARRSERDEILKDLVKIYKKNGYSFKELFKMIHMMEKYSQTSKKSVRIIYDSLS